MILGVLALPPIIEDINVNDLCQPIDSDGSIMSNETLVDGRF